MNLHLTDKVFIITGGAQGIGEAIVQGIADEGGIPVIVDRNESTATALKDQLKAKNQNTLSIVAKLSSAEDCQAVIQEVISQLGQIDGLINNAGTNDGISLEKGNPDDYLQSFENNLHHYFYMAHYALPYLKKTKGSIINVSSKTAITGQGGASAYVAAKGAQLALTRDWAVELSQYEIRVNALIPAEVMTPMYQNWLDSFPNPEEKLEEINQRIPLGNRMTTAEEMANMALFLLSEKASHITGQHLHVDGGYVHLDRAMAGLKKK